MKLRLIVFAFVLCLIGCRHDHVLAPAPPDLGRVWVATEPIQCLGNPWEQYWLETHGRDYASYPKDPATPGLEPQEIAIIKDFYRRHRVIVSAADTGGHHGIVCAACSCPEGYTLYLQIRRQDLKMMLAFGYREESPISAST